MADITSLLPTSGAILTELTAESMPSYTYLMDIPGQSIHGYVDEQEAVKQAIYKILRTERYRYPVYSWNYGIELEDLFGKPTPYVEVELKRRIKEALEWDDRIEKCDSFVFMYPDHYTVNVSFTAHTIYGAMEIDEDISQIDDTALDPYWYVDGKTLTATWRATASISGHSLVLPVATQQTVDGETLVILGE